MKSFLILFALLINSIAFGGDFVEVNVRKIHLDIDIFDRPPILNFYATRKLNGKPVIQLNKQRLVIRDKMVCRWPAPGFRKPTDKPQMIEGMILGFSSADQSDKSFTYKKCPRGQPVISTISEAGAGQASLYIEVEKTDEDIVESRLDSKPVFLSVKSIPGKYSILPPGSLSNLGD